MFFRQHHVDRTNLLVRFANQTTSRVAVAELERMGAGRIADAFIESRLAGQWRTTYGMVDARHDARLIVDTLYPPTN